MIKRRILPKKRARSRAFEPGRFGAGPDIRLTVTVRARLFLYS